MGAAAIAALGRNNATPVRTALGRDADPLATFIRLLLVGDPVDARTVDGLLPAGFAPLLERDGAEVRAPIEVAPHGDEDNDWWVLSDRVDARGRPKRRDHVLGVGGASATLAQLTVRRPVARALDIGTGCGIQSLHLARHADAVTATDVVPRALSFAATTFALSGAAVELLEGDLTDPVAGREFDLVVCNPPFVIGPDARFDYRDGGLDDDEMSRAVVRGAAGVVADGGVAQLLVNWLHVTGEPWEERVAAWVAGLGCDAWLLERDRQDPVDYVDTWLTDAGEREPELVERWLRWLRERDVEAIGFGWVVLRRCQGPHRIAVEELSQPVEQPLGSPIAHWLDAVEWLRSRDDEALLDACLTSAPAVRRDVVERAGDDGWRSVAQSLRLDDGFRWSLPCDDATSAIVAGCDGATPLRRLVAVLAAVTGAPEPEVAAAACAAVRGLIDRGLLLPPSP